MGVAMEHPTLWAAAVMVGDYMVIIGGWHGSNTLSLDTTTMWNHSIQTWIQHPAVLQTEWAFAKAVMLGEDILIYGGIGSNKAELSSQLLSKWIMCPKAHCKPNAMMDGCMHCEWE